MPIAIAIVAAGAIVAVALVVTRSGDKKTAAPAGPTPTTTASTTPSTPDFTATATPTPTTTPTTTTTAPPSPTSTVTTLPGGAVLGQSCTNPQYGYRLNYPDGWHAELTFSGWQCALFDPKPFTVTPDTEVPPVTVIVSVADFPYNSSVAQYTDPGSYQLLSRTDLTVDGAPAVAVEVLTTQNNAPLPVGTSRYAVLVDLGAKTLLIETNSIDADDYVIAKHVVRGMADSLRRMQ